MTKKIDTLPEDIYKLLASGNVLEDSFYQELATRLATKVKLSIERSKEKPRIRMSNIGKGDRYLWYVANKGSLINERDVELKGHTLLNFLYGDIVEEIVLWLSKAAGHSVTEEQKRVEVEGIQGSQDCRIDGVGSDVKSTSGYGFRKFLNKGLLENDDYGYLYQLNGYFEGEPEKAFVAVNKETGEIVVSKYEDKELPSSKQRIKHIKSMVKEKEAPSEKCHPPITKGPNKSLSTFCTSCPFKFECWKDANNGNGLRMFKYASGTEYLVEVNNEPRVQEVDRDGKEIPKKEQQEYQSPFSKIP